MRAARAAPATAAFMVSAALLTGFLRARLGLAPLAFICSDGRLLDFSSWRFGLIGVKLRRGLALFAKIALLADRRLVAVEIAVPGGLIERLRLRTLRGAQDAEIVLCVLKIVFSLHAVAARLGVVGERLIFVVNLLRGPANADVRPVRVERAVGINALPAALVIIPAALFEMIIHARMLFSLFTN